MEEDAIWLNVQPWNGAILWYERIVWHDIVPRKERDTGKTTFDIFPSEIINPWLPQNILSEEAGFVLKQTFMLVNLSIGGPHTSGSVRDKRP